MYKKSLVAFIAGSTIAGAGLYWWHSKEVESLTSQVTELQNTVTTKTDELLGYTRYTDYLSAGKAKLHEQTKLLAASVVREEGFTRVVNKNVLGLSSDSVVAVWYTAEYSFGYDLSPNNYEITDAPTGINIRINRPLLISSPATKSLRHKILSGGMFTDDKTAVIKLYEGIPERTMEMGQALASNEAVIALCEKKLIAFLKDFLAKQSGVTKVPNITVTYKPEKPVNPPL